MADGNPYARMAALMRGGDETLNSVKLYRGAVVGTAPLIVSLAGIRQPAESLLLCAGLELVTGDTVLALTEDDQVFYIIMKVANTV